LFQAVEQQAIAQSFHIAAQTTMQTEALLESQPPETLETQSSP